MSSQDPAHSCMRFLDISNIKPYFLRNPNLKLPIPTPKHTPLSIFISPLMASPTLHLLRIKSSRITSSSSILYPYNISPLEHTVGCKPFPFWLCNASYQSAPSQSHYSTHFPRGSIKLPLWFTWVRFFATPILPTKCRWNNISFLSKTLFKVVLCL